MFLVHVDGEIFKLSVGKGFDDLGTKETTVSLRRSKDDKGIMLWEQCEQTEADEAQDNLVQRKTIKTVKKRLTHDKLLKVFTSKTKRYSVAEVYNLSPCGRDWTDSSLKELVREERLRRIDEKNPKGQANLFFQLPTVLEPGGIAPDDKDDEA
jgi:hypothetical protein